MFKEDQPYIPQPQVQRPENIFSRIAKADNKTLQQAQQLLSKYGVRKAVNKLDMYTKLMALYKAKREEIIPELLEIHPDKSLFENYFSEINSDALKQSQQQHDAEMAQLKQGFEDQLKDMKMDLRFAGIKNYDADGSSSATNNQSPALSHSTELVIAGSIVALVGVIGLSMVAMAHSSHAKN